MCFNFIIKKGLFKSKLSMIMISSVNTWLWPCVSKSNEKFDKHLFTSLSKWTMNSLEVTLRRNIVTFEGRLAVVVQNYTPISLSLVRFFLSTGWIQRRFVRTHAVGTGIQNSNKRIRFKSEWNGRIDTHY